MSEMLSRDVLFRRRPAWRATVHIKDLLSNDSTDENAVRVAQAIADRLEKSGHFAETNLVNRFRRTRTLNGVNRNLEALYNWCDDERIWLGL